MMLLATACIARTTYRPGGEGADCPLTGRIVRYEFLLLEFRTGDTSPVAEIVAGLDNPIPGAHEKMGLAVALVDYAALEAGIAAKGYEPARVSESEDCFLSPFHTASHVLQTAKDRSLLTENGDELALTDFKTVSYMLRVSLVAQPDAGPPGIRITPFYRGNAGDTGRKSRRDFPLAKAAVEIPAVPEYAVVIWASGKYSETFAPAFTLDRTPPRERIVVMKFLPATHEKEDV